MRAAIAETWTTRRAYDEARHLATCRVCREKLRPREDQKLYFVKNARTREARHVLINGQDLAETIGWPEHEIPYSLLIEDGTKKAPPMTEEVKARLRAAAAERKLRKSLRANTPARSVDGAKEKEGGLMTKKKKMKGGRMFVFDIPVTKVLLWMGRDGFKPTGAAAALRATGVSRMPTEGTIRAHLGLGKTEKFAPKMAKLTTEQQKTLRDAAKTVTA